MRLHHKFYDAVRGNIFIEYVNSGEARNIWAKPTLFKWKAERDPGVSLRLLPLGPDRLGDRAARADLPLVGIGGSARKCNPVAGGVMGGVGENMVVFGCLTLAIGGLNAL